MSPGDDRPVAEVQVTGEVVGAVADGVERFSAEPRATGRSALAERGLADPRSDEWYPLSAVLDAIAAIEGVVDDRGVIALGERVGRVVVRPSSVAGVAGALDALDDDYRCNHRGGDPGGYAFRQIGDVDGRVECDTPYPCAFDRGIVRGVAASVADGFVCLREVGVCRADGAPRCTYELSW